jgi:hypothetical protein
MRRYLLVPLLALLAVPTAVGCSGSPTPCDETGTCAPSNEPDASARCAAEYGARRSRNRAA